MIYRINDKKKTIKDQIRKYIPNNRILVIIFTLLISMTIYNSVATTIYPSYNTEQDCRNCHGITVDRHHLLVANGTHQCTDCHAIKYDEINLTYYPEVIRNCLTCHPGKDHTDVHHLLVAQGLFVCSDCHQMKYDEINQSYYPEVTWDCTVCHSTVLRLNDTPPPAPTPTLPNPPTVTNFSPSSPVHDIIGASRKFDISIDQTVDLIWYIDDSIVQINNGVAYASYTNTSALLGVWNVSVNASNINGNVTFTWTWNVTTLPPPPEITSFAPLYSPVNDTAGSSRKFGITIDQTADITWYINDNPVQYNNGVMGASYNNTSASSGTWNVKAVATNANGSATYSWEWYVVPNPKPITTIDPPNPNGLNGWYVTDTIYLNATDTDGIKYTNYSVDGGMWYSIPGSELKTPVILADGIHSIQYYSVDNLNGIESTQTQTVNIDNTSPHITINSPVNGSIYILNQNLIADWSASDITSGILTATGTYPSGNTIDTTLPGKKNFSVYAEDNAGNIDAENATYYIRYTFGNFLQPINNDGSSIFKLGNTIPIKFQLTDANGNYVTNAVAKLRISKVTSTITGTILEPYTTGTATIGDIFIYESNGHMYMYNLATKGMSIGTWQIRVDIIDDGSFYTVDISLRK